MYVTRKRVVLRFSQRLTTRLDFFELLVLFIPLFLFTKSTKNTACAVYQQRFQELVTVSMFWRRMYRLSETWGAFYHRL